MFLMCPSHERTLTQTPGIERAVVTLATGRGHIDFDPSIIGPRDIINLIEVYSEQNFYWVVKIMSQNVCGCVYL